MISDRLVSYWDSWMTWQSYFYFLRNFHTVLHQGYNSHSHCLSWGCYCCEETPLPQHSNSCEDDVQLEWLTSSFRGQSIIIMRGACQHAGRCGGEVAKESYILQGTES